MKIVVMSTMVPFVHGGAEELYHHLLLNLNATPGVSAEGFRLPFTWDPAERLIDEMLICRHIRLSNVDRVISLKFPAYLVPWHNKVIWLLHQYRQAYDLLEVNQSNIPDTKRGHEILSAIKINDNIAFSEAARIHTIAPTVSERLKRFNGFSSEVLRHPLNDPEIFTGGNNDGYILATGRINASKRQHLLVEALRYAPGVKLIIAGPPDTPADGERLLRLAHENRVDDRVKLDLRFLPRNDIATLVNNSAAVAYIPYDEDSIGYCTMEALQAQKPLLTVTDAGGVLDIIRHRDTGLVVSPDPEKLGKAMLSFVQNPSLTAQMGKAGAAAMRSAQLNWPNTIERLLS